MKAILIPTDTEPTLIEVDGELSAIQEKVGGWIEHVQLDKNSAYINEEGKLHGLPYNAVATELAHRYRSIFPDDFIVGPMVVFGATSYGGDITDVDDAMIQRLGL